MKIRLLILTILALFIVKATAAQPKTDSQAAQENCTLAPSIDITKGAPLIYGDPYLILSLELKFVVKATGKSVTPKQFMSIITGSGSNILILNMRGEHG
ncbi:hypothetical protein [Edaphobacter aggregans]|uniref:hypothetical protein n=1 Tax=Edaphobacter aggregans TaxID=570835 RepID=UPI0005520946|nr:hypothetical protein [Edaphobacter aggregans]